jgi:hemolysin activation/secretion protein
VSASKDDRIDAVYNAGNVVSQYRHREDKGELFGGWSPGLQDGWVQRYSLGLSYEKDAHAVEPGLVAPAQLPIDEKLVAPFARYELIEDRYDRELNRNLIGRPEFFALGLNSRLQLGRASTGLGSSRNAWLYSGSISRGFEPFPEHMLIAAASFSGQYGDGQVRRQRLGAQAQYYLPQGRRWLFYAGASGDMLTRPELPDLLLLGGDNGLRGYPLRYQSGTRRALFTVEERFYTDLYVWQLFRIGGAAFFDVGRAWGGDFVNTVNPGWLSNAGVGMRIVSARAAFSNVLHLDLAFPLNTTPDIKKVQFIVKTKTSF